MANDGVSMREFARQVGRSAAYVSGKCKTGELPLVDGKIPLEEGLKAFKALVKSEERKKASDARPERPWMCSREMTRTTSKYRPR